MAANTTRFRAVVAIVAAMVTLMGCDEHSPSAASEPPADASPWAPPESPATAASASTSASHRTEASSCPQDWTPLTVVTDVPEEVRYIKDVAACVSPDGRQTYLSDEGDGVWVPTTTRTWEVQPDRYYRSQLAKARAAAYQVSMREEFQNEMLTPGEGLVVPVSPAELSWQLELGYTMTWHLHDWMLTEIQAASQQSLVNALDKRTRRGAAVAECTINLYKILERQPDLTDEAPTTRLLAAVSDTADGATCVQKWREADRAARLGQSAPEEAVVTADRLSSALRSSPTEAVSRLDTFLGRFSSVLKVVRIGAHR